MNALLKKLQLKDGYRAAVVSAPESLSSIADDIRKAGIAVATQISGKQNWMLIFVTQAKELAGVVSRVKKSLEDGGLVWFAYPKAKKLETDLNRDVLRETLEPAGLTAVSIVSIDDTWSALRCKRE